MPTRIEMANFVAAQTVGAQQGRSATQQINFWIRLGRALEGVDGIRVSDIEEVLAGRASYDSLGALEQRVVRADWDKRIAERRDALDLEAEFLAEGEEWVEADERGETHVRGKRTRKAATGSRTARPKSSKS